VGGDKGSPDIRKKIVRNERKISGIPEGNGVD
jgi:hypothetical protein